MRGAQGAKHRQTVEHGQHAVEDDEIETAVGRAEQAVLAVGRLFDAMTFLGQSLGEIAGGFAIVLNQQDLAAHKRSVRLPSLIAWDLKRRLPRGAPRGRESGTDATRKPALVRPA